MTRAQRRRLERHVHQYIEKWRAPLGLNRWQIKVTFGPLTDTEGSPAAGCAALSRYRDAEVQFDLDQYVEALRDPTVLERDVVHELMHCHTAKLRELAEWLWTRLVEETDEGATVDLERLPAFDRLRDKPKRR
jgi:hypothetical protein